MCGIYCSLRFTGQCDQISEVIMRGLIVITYYNPYFVWLLQQIHHKTRELLSNRGPNASSELQISIDNCELHFSGFVLWQQGDHLCQQPHSYKQHVLLLNGDIFSKRCDLSQSDTEWLCCEIDKCKNNSDLLELFRKLEGPYSVVFFNRDTGNLYFIRDSLGRQSLLLAGDELGNFFLSSVLGESWRYSDQLQLKIIHVFIENL